MLGTTDAGKTCLFTLVLPSHLFAPFDACKHILTLFLYLLAAVWPDTADGDIYERKRRSACAGQQGKKQKWHAYPLQSVQFAQLAAKWAHFFMCY